MIWRAIADLLMPRVCLVCGRALDTGSPGDGGAGEEHLCTECWKDLPRTRYWKLRENPMAESFNALIQRNMGEDMQYQPYSYAAALYFYKGGYREISKALKYRRNFAAGRCFGRLLGKTLAETELFRDVDLVVPIPLHWTRRWRRGYNQAEVIARGVALELGARCEQRLLRRARRTKTQTHLNAEGRVANVAGAFRVNARNWRRLVTQEPPSPHRPPSSCQPTSPHHFLLIDDVFTTGATAAACERAIREALRTATPGRNSNNARRVRISIATLACVER
ncbi:MAG: ComF family protein [Bacteroidales bacterium]|nr:ComF family protein [Bacteroidales bacterium]